MRTFTFAEGKSFKFWMIDLAGNQFTVTYGRVGTAGQTKVKTFSSPEAARKEHDSLIAEKLGKGYTETTPTVKAPASLRESLEQAVLANPDDLASHMAYADHLSDEGDPRGEFIRVQLALEDPGRTPAERKQLAQQEKKLLKTHARAWLGDLAPLLLDQKPEEERKWDEVKVEYSFRRGWLDTLKLRQINVAFTRALAPSPCLRMLHRLEIVDQNYEEPGEYEPGDGIPEDCYTPALYPLVRSPHLGNVRVLVLGEMPTEKEEDDEQYGWNCHTSGEGVVDMIKRMPHLEELYLLAHDVDTEQLFSMKTLHKLRILQVYHGSAYPLGRLAKNTSLGKLTHLLCHPHAVEDLEEGAYIKLAGVRDLATSPSLSSLTHLRLRCSDMGDRGVRALLDSGILKRLRMLDLRHGCITDAGAALLAADPALRNLEVLDVGNNSLTSTGIAALQATGVTVRTSHQWRPTGDDWQDGEYLFAGDIE
jgi:uncharacterized protein (TIGR02996 family)